MGKRNYNVHKQKKKKKKKKKKILSYVEPRTQYGLDMSLTGNAKICCLGLVLALFLTTMVIKNDFW